MQRAIHLQGDDIGTILRNLCLDVGLAHGRLDRVSPERRSLTIPDCAAPAEGDAFSWFALIDVAPHPALRRRSARSSSSSTPR